MPTPLRRRLRFARRGFGYALALALVLVALLLGTVSQVLPLAESHPDRVAAWLSQRAGRQVAFDRVQTQWTRRGPLLQLDNLRIGAGTQAFTIGDTEMLVSVYAGLLPGKAFSELRLRGLDLTLERAADGRWQVRGLPGQQTPGGDPFAALEGLGELQVIGGKLAIHAPALGIDTTLPKIDLRLRVDGDRVRAGVRAWPRVQAKPLDAVLDFDRKRGDGRAYAGARQADLAAWSPLLRLAGIGVESGHGRAEAWAELRGHRIAEVTVDAALDQVGLRGAPLPGNASSQRVRFARVESRARWRLDAAARAGKPGVPGWRFDAPKLRIGSGAQRQTLDGLVLAGGERYALLAQRVDAAPLFALAALSDRLSPALRSWLQAARPQASLQQIEVTGRRDGALHARARISGLGFGAVGTAPGVCGLGGQLDGDADGFSLQLDPGAATAFDWPHGFGVVRTVKLDGLVSGWREGGGWRIGTPALRVAGDGFGVNARGGLWWQGDGTRPWIDIAADIDHASVPVAKGFWVRHLMSPALVQWLDTALVAGTVRDGHAIISGDLDHWPFRDRNGRFEASAHIGQGTVKFQPDWPAVEGVEADARFIADGFTVDGTGRLGQVDIAQLHAGIDHYKDGALVVTARGGGDARQLLDVLRRSPLEKQHRDTFANLTVSGAADATFDLKLPLARGSKLALGGTVALRDARLADARWKLAFDQVNGGAQYSRSGFRADELRVRHEGQPGRLALRAGDGYVREPRNVFEAGLDASLGADELIDRGPKELAWLKPHLDGRSTWTVGIAIPKSAAGRAAPTLLQLRSNLVGTALDLPAPLRKPAAAALATSVETPLPLGSGDIRVGLGNLMALRARSGNGQTGVRVVLGAARVDDAPPASGLVATGNAGALDAIDWIALARGGEGGAGLPLQRIDVNAQRLLLLGGAFPDTRVVVVPAASGATAVRAEGAALDGALLVSPGNGPAGDGATVAGRFARVHWRSAAAANAGSGASSAAARASGTATASRSRASMDAGFDPARIPPLALDIDDLRVADARLGTAKLRTRSSAAGMRIEQFLARADKQRIDLSGDWTGRGVAARSRFDVRIGSDDFGALLAGFGFGGRLGGGSGTARFDAGWPGSPAEFRLDALDGSLVLDARDGRLLEVEPGAGRVLGLLSLAELPRRLTLDFRDFFSKGFAFNTIGGTVRFAGGSARSDKLAIDGPAAAIDIRGTANLRAQSFDQTIEVRPKSGNLLTVAGAIAGGPVGAAIGAAANAVLQKPLGQLGAKTYRVTGPWKEPKVEVISRAQSRVSAVPPVPAG
ncbi:YhdP family protein [Lysobacter koreensis]|uniref:YhdP family protein n=1 Tax=Lysobacter koreensis TaxID=266122 RepID=A0ABW2YMP0_9GAMM